MYDNSGQGVQITGVTRTGAGNVPGGAQDVGFSLPPGKHYDMVPQPIEGAGIAVAIDLESISPDFTLERLHVAAEERTLFGA